MNNAKEDCPLRSQSKKLIVEELPDELMIFDPERNKAFCLNQTASFVWKQADGKTPVAEIGKRLAQHIGEPVDEQIIWFALDMLSKDGLLGSAAVLPPVHPGVTRRHLLQKMGVGAIALPVVSVLLVSPAKAHASARRRPPLRIHLFLQRNEILAVSGSGWKTCSKLHDTCSDVKVARGEGRGIRSVMKKPVTVPACAHLAVLRSERNAALDAVLDLPKRYASAEESEVIFGRLTSAHKVEIQHKLECPTCKASLESQVA